MRFCKTCQAGIGLMTDEQYKMACEEMMLCPACGRCISKESRFYDRIWLDENDAVVLFDNLPRKRFRTLIGQRGLSHREAMGKTQIRLSDLLDIGFRLKKAGEFT